MSESENKPKTRIVDFLYIGVRKNFEKDKPVENWLWYELPDNRNDGTSLEDDYSDDRNFLIGRNKRRNNIFSASPGTVVKIERTENSVRPDTCQIVGRWNNEADVIRWQAESRLIQLEIQQTQKAFLEIKENLPESALAPFRDVYKNCRNAQQRANFLGYVIALITK